MRLRLWLAVAGLVTGCGMSPLAPFEPDEPARQQQPYPTTLKGGPDQDAIDRLFAAVEAQRAVTGQRYTAAVYSRGAFGGRKPAAVPWAGGGEWEGRTTWEVDYLAPSGYKLQVVAATEPGRVGLKVLLDAQGATLRSPGLKGLIARKRELNDPELADYRGHALPLLTPAATIARLGGAATARLVGETRLENTPLDLVEVPRSPGFDPEVAREVLGLERGTATLRLHQQFAADGRKVYEQLLLGLRPLPGAPGIKLAI